MYEVLENPQDPHYPALKKTLLFLALCHTIIIDEKKGKYNASSPDELALVNAAKQFGFEFKGRDKNDNLLVWDNHSEKMLIY